jgi:hypothetical protein
MIEPATDSGVRRMLQPLVADEDDFRGRFRRFLPRSKDLTLIVLKGHLLVEEAINGLIDEHLSNPAALASARLGFAQRLAVLRALLSEGAFEHWLDSAEKLNTLRNRMAHQLAPPQLERHIAEFLRTLEDPDVPSGEFEREAISKRLRRAIALLCGVLNGCREGYSAAKQTRSS